MFESVNTRTYTLTHSRTPAGLLSFKLTLCAFGSGELKMGGSIVLSIFYLNNISRICGKMKTNNEIKMHANIAIILYSSNLTSIT